MTHAPQFSDFQATEIPIQDPSQGDPNEEYIIIVNTGGTFSCEKDATSGRLSTSATIVPHWLRANLQLFEGIKMRYFQINKFFDSATATPKHWFFIVKSLIELSDRNPRCQGFVIIHGTDTLAYTAAALSFVPTFSKPIILTGAQYPLSFNNSDAYTNLYGSLLCCRNLAKHNITRNHTFVFFHRKLMMAPKVRKAHAIDLDAFESVNCIPVGLVLANTAEFSSKFVKALRKKEEKKGQWKLQAQCAHLEMGAPEERTTSSTLSAHPCDKLMFCESIALFRINPLFDVDILKSSNRRVIILQVYGTGNVPTHLTDILAQDSAHTYFACTECYNGKTVSAYSVSVESKEENCISLVDMTAEAALVKASVIGGRPFYKPLFDTPTTGKLPDNINILVAFDELAVKEKLYFFFHSIVKQSFKKEVYKSSAEVKEVIAKVFELEEPTILQDYFEADKFIKSVKRREKFPWIELAQLSTYCDFVKSTSRIGKLLFGPLDLDEAENWAKIMISYCCWFKDYSQCFQFIESKEKVESVCRMVRLKSLFQAEMIRNTVGEITNEHSMKSKDSYLSSHFS